MSTQLDRISWIYPITEVVSLLSDIAGESGYSIGNAKPEDWP